MKNLPIDIDVREIVSITEDLRSEYSSFNLDWVGSPFAWIKDLLSFSKLMFLISVDTVNVSLGI